MEIPGEKLIIRIWETLSEKGIGAIFRPSLVRREGVANIEVRRAEMLVLAQAEREVKEIQSGHKDLSDFSLKISFMEKKENNDLLVRTEPTLNLETLAHASEKQQIINALRKEINVTKAVLHAEQAVIDDGQEPPLSKVDTDWLFRWRDYVGDVSLNDMQELWGRLLVSEIKSPGRYSLRSLDFLRNLSPTEAKLIERLSSLVVEGLIWEGGTVELITFDELLELENLGVLSGVSAGGLVNNTSTQKSNDGWVRILRASKKCLVARHTENKIIKLRGYRATALGEQIISVGRLDDNIEYLHKIGTHLVTEGFNVMIADYTEDGTSTFYTNGVKIG
ncbi:MULTISPECIES: DUF2806 domain-containing protein [Pseudomonas]|uniref:Membrane-fusion protein n=1 Tax=Pseudomonas fluorescens (strain Q2-87) TaxID=1038922 RepID=J2YEB2_PSEFQ|nr:MULTISPECIES: DUF2806 domain-containing protein [Pseudomonas]EJL05626.1 hypothetical protein PflQ2_4514 [Pseudomonas fluorescens Q2-87]